MSTRLLNELLENNRDWASRMERAHPGFFHRLAGRQAPELLWIGCYHSCGPALPQREAERLEHQLGAQMSLHRPAQISPGNEAVLEMLQTEPRPEGLTANSLLKK